MDTSLVSLQAAKRQRQQGFGLVELLVTVAILGVLVLVAIPVFGSIQRTAANNVTKSSIEQLSTAIELARTKENKALRYITNSSCTMCGFNAGVDPLTVPKSTGGWVTYNNSLNAIGRAAGMELKDLVDGYGRPLYLDENEDEGGCRRDLLASYKNPYVGRGAADIDNVVNLYTFKC